MSLPSPDPRSLAAEATWRYATPSPHPGRPGANAPAAHVSAAQTDEPGAAGRRGAREIRAGLAPLLLAGWLGGWLVSPAIAHPVPDGLIFRGIQVILWKDRIDVRYQLGLSDNTVQQELQSLVGPDEVIPADAAAALSLYRDKMYARLPAQIQVFVDGQSCALRPWRADIVRQPHMQIECFYRIPHQATTQSQQFYLQDENFPQVPGLHLAAVKGRGEVEVVESNAQPVLSRMPRLLAFVTEQDASLEPMRRLEAYFHLAAKDSPESAAEPSLAIEPAPSTAADPALLPPEETPPSGAAIPKDSVPAETPRASRDGSWSASPSRYVFPILGGLIVLAAVVWMLWSKR